MTTPTFTAPPAAPSRLTDQPVTFVTKVDAFVAWIVVFVGQLVAAVAWFVDRVTEVDGNTAAALAAAQAAVNATTLCDISSSNLSIGMTAKAFTLTKLTNTFTNTERARAFRKSDPTTFMEGPISAASMGTNPQTMTITPDTVGGAGGPYSDWIVVDAGLVAIAAALAADIWAATTGLKAITPLALKNAVATGALTDASTVAWDIRVNGVNTTVTLGGNRTIGAPSNLYDNLDVELELVQDATGSRVPSFAGIWEWGSAGPPSLQTAAGKADIVAGRYFARTGKIHANFRRGA